MKISEYPSKLSPENNDLLIIEDGGGAGTKSITASNFYGGLKFVDDNDENAAITHRNVFRGKNLGNTFTDSQKEAISSGTFNDLFVGDYWADNNIKWRIADVNYCLNTENHLLIIPDNVLYSARIHSSSDISSVGLANSELYTTGLKQAISLFESMFGEEHVLSFYEYLVSAVNKNADGCISAHIQSILKTSLMSPDMVYGNLGLKNPTTNESVISMRTAISNIQAALFVLNPKFRFLGENYWLDDVINSQRVGFYIENGLEWYAQPNIVKGIRPYFCLKGD